jgi:hypothetical protein
VIVNDKTIDTSKTIVTFNGGIENINDASFNNDICTHMSEAEVKKIIAHAQEKVIHEAVITPEHDKRTESRLFRETKKRLKEDGRDYCWICGAKNPEAHLEIHHFLAEWSLAGVVDYDKLKKLCELFDVYGYAEEMKDVPLESVDDIRNCMALCRAHHQGLDKANNSTGCGIHNLTFPAWIIQKVCKDGHNPIPQPGESEENVFDREKDE